MRLAKCGERFLIEVFISDGYTTDDITYKWKEVDPVQIAQGLNLPRFSIEEYGSTYCNVKTNTGTLFFFRRKFSLDNHATFLHSLLRDAGKPSPLSASKSRLTLNDC